MNGKLGVLLKTYIHVMMLTYLVSLFTIIYHIFLHCYYIIISQARAQDYFLSMYVKLNNT